VDADLRETINTLLIPTADVTLDKLVGKGHFGNVYRAHLRDSYTGQVWRRRLRA